MKNYIIYFNPEIQQFTYFYCPPEFFLALKDHPCVAAIRNTLGDSINLCEDLNEKIEEARAKWEI